MLTCHFTRQQGSAALTVGEFGVVQDFFMKDEDLDNLASNTIEDLGLDVARRKVFGKTKDYGGDACKKVFGDGVVGFLGSAAVNILTGGSFQLLKWLGPAEKVGKTLGKKGKDRANKKWAKWEKDFDALQEEFVALVKQLHRKDISDSEHKLISKKIDRVNKKQDRLFKKIPF